jgi:hypothetical protein
MAKLITNLHISNHGSFEYQYRSDPCVVDASACFSLYIIREAWDAGVDFEELADGYGEGGGTHGDWSSIRDSSDGAITAMLERALNAMTFNKRS